MAMKILRINTKYKGSGAEKTAKTLNRALNELNNVQSVFAYGEGTNINKSNFFYFGNLFETYIHGFLSRVFGIEGYGNYFSNQKLLKYIKKNNFDLIHLHNIHSFSLNLSFIEQLKKLNIAVVWTLHDAWAITGSCMYPGNCQKRQTGCKKCPNKRKIPKSLISSSHFMWKKKRDVFSKNWQPFIVTPSKWLKKQVQKSFLKNRQIKVIPNAINTNLFKPRNKEKLKKKFNIPKNKKVILFGATDLKKKRKGAKYFLKALPKIKAKNWMVLTIGKKIDPSIISNNIDIKQLGYMSSRSKIAKIYNTADLFCITSLFDNLPTTVNESLASGIPVVGFKTGGIPEQVTKNCGILVEKKNIKSLAENITKLLNNNKKRKEFSKNSRKKAINNYSIPIFRDNYLKLYKKILQNKNK